MLCLEKLCRGPACSVAREHSTSSSHFHAPDMTSRTGLEADAISRLTDGLQPAAMRAILVQCLAGEVAPSTADCRMIAIAGATTVRTAIDEVTRRAATVSGARDRSVGDRGDDLTPVVVDEV